MPLLKLIRTIQRLPAPSGRHSSISVQAWQRLFHTIAIMFWRASEVLQHLGPHADAKPKSIRTTWGAWRRKLDVAHVAVVAFPLVWVYVVEVYPSFHVRP